MVYKKLEQPTMTEIVIIYFSRKGFHSIINQNVSFIFLEPKIAR